MQSSLDLNGGQEILSLNVAGSNAIILPGRKHSTKKKNKVSEIQKKKRSVEHSKSQQKKLKKIQEDKEKELLISKSIETLEKYKIGDVAQSLMWTSKNLGQVENFQAKRRREVQFSKAGLRLPTNNQPIKRKTDDNTSELELHSKRVHIRENCDVSNFTYPLIGDRGCMQDDICGDICGDVGRCEAPIRFKETSYENSKIPVPVNQPNLLPSSIFTVPKEDKTMDKIHRYEAGHLSSISNLANGHPGGARTAHIAVHVSRPPEIESTRKDLPIVMMEQEIMEAINENICVIICGETGCGKTTQVPQFLYEAGFGSSRSSVKSGMIGVTQPRRVAVLATARRVAFELGLCLGKEVGFQVRHDKRIGDNCSIKFMTDGILLRELQNDFLLKKYSVIVLDEAHERSLNTDILIGMLSRIIHERQRIYEEQKHQEILLKIGTSLEKVYPLKLVLMSATLRIEDFVSGGRIFSEPPPVIEVPARQFPVDIHFSKRTEIVDYVGQAYKKVLSIHKNLPPGGILVFVTGQREVEYLCQKLRKASRKMVTNRSRQIGNAPALLKVNCAEDHVINDISKALEIEGDLILQQTDRFSTYDDDYDDLPEDESDASFDSNEDSDLEVSGKDMYFFGQNSMGSDDFPREDGNFTSLKAAFDALAGKNTSKLSTDGKKTALDTAKGPDHCTLSLGENTGESSVPPVSPMCVLPLYAMLPAAAQLRVFDKVKDGERLVVIATNVAETSLTIPGTKYVVDTGREKVKLHDSANGIETYNVQWISKASAAQRAGRAGRTGPGHCYRLFSSAVFSNVFHDFSTAEISKIPVDGVVLLMKSMGIDKVVNFPFPTPPKVAAIKQAEKCLKDLEALDTNGRLTPLGKAMVHYPMSPRHSRMLLTAIQILQKDKVSPRPNLVLGYAVAAAAALSLSNPFITQLEGNNDENSDTGASERVLEKEEKQRKKKLKEAARASRENFCNPTSDILSTAYALQCFELSNSPIGFCAKYALHLKTMGEMSKLRRQLLKLVFQQSDDFQQDFTWTRGRMVDVESSWRDVSKEKHLSMYEEELLGQAICAGCVDRVARKIRACSDGDKKGYANRYQACTVNETVILHCRSSLSRSAPEYLVYSELLHTKHPYIHRATTVKPEWLVRYASSLCTFSAPRICYEHLSDQVLCRMTPIYGPCQWQLPVHSSPIKDDAQRVAVFAYSLIGGYVLPCLKYARNFLANSPAIILRAESSGHKRVGNLLSKLKMRIKTIDSCAVLKEVWSENPLELYPEILDWFQERFCSRFDELWAEMQREVLLDPVERFAKK